MDRRKSRVRKDVKHGDMIIKKRGWYIPLKYAKIGDPIGHYNENEKTVLFMGYISEYILDFLLDYN